MNLDLTFVIITWLKANILFQIWAKVDHLNQCDYIQSSAKAWHSQSLCITYASGNIFHIYRTDVIFFTAPVIPQGYHAQVIHGFVEELVVNDDPEYQWIDKIRTPRASNEARQTLFFKLSGEVQRKIWLKALDLGGNAVIG
jgi:hypothetical protein